MLDAFMKKSKVLIAGLLMIALLASMAGCSLRIESEDEGETTEETGETKETEETVEPEETLPPDNKQEESEKHADWTLYKPVLDMFYESISCKWTNCDTYGYEDLDDPDSACYIFWHYEKSRTLDEVGYTLIDINNDQQPELFVSMLDIGADGSFYNMYTLIDGEIVQVISAGERDGYQLAEDLSINNYGSSGAGYSQTVNYRLGDDGKLYINQAVVFDGYQDSENPWFYADEDFTYENKEDVLKSISEEEASERIENFPKTKDLALTAFSKYPYEGKPENTDQDKEDVLNALNALLIGAEYDYAKKESSVSQWTDEMVCDMLWGKLLWDNYYNEASYLYQYGLRYYYGEDGYTHFQLEDIQKITQDTLGRDFPTNKVLDYMYVSGNEVLMMRAIGESRTLVVQDYRTQGNLILAVGTAVYNNNANSEFLGYFQAVFEENPSSIYGYTLYSLSTAKSNQDFSGITATASTELKEGSVTHKAGNVLDGNLSTAWVEGAYGVGINQWLRLTAADSSQMEISAIGIAAGYQKSEDALNNNGWPYKFRIEAENGYQQDAEIYYYDDVIILDQPITTSWIKITILEASSGEKYDDTCISEIYLYGIDTESFFP